MLILVQHQLSSFKFQASSLYIQLLNSLVDLCEPNVLRQPLHQRLGCLLWHFVRQEMAHSLPANLLLPERSTFRPIEMTRPDAFDVEALTELRSIQIQQWNGHLPPCRRAGSAILYLVVEIDCRARSLNIQELTVSSARG